MARGARNYGTYAKMTWYITPTEEQLFQRYNPDLQRRSLENRQERQQDFDDFVVKLKEYSKSDKPIWLVAKEDEKKRREDRFAEQQKLVDEVEKRKAEIRKETGSLVPGGSL